MTPPTRRSSATGSSAKKGSSDSSSSSSKKTSANGSTSAAAKKKAGGDAPSRRRAPSAERRPAAKVSKIVAEAAGELLALTGKPAEGVTGVERTDEGWTLLVEVVEVRRIPDTTDVLALYEVRTDDQGALLGYQRVRRYARGVPGDD